MSKVSNNFSWLSKPSYDVLISLCGTFIPSTSSSDVSNTIKQSLHALIPRLSDDCCDSLINKSDITIDYLQRGAVEGNVPAACVRKLHNCVTNYDKKKLSLVLWVLSYSVGNFLLTGYFRPFHRLSLQQREYAVTSWKQSRFVVFRTLYQTFKRLTGLMFFSYNERGHDNQTWKALSYDPSITVNKPSRNLAASHNHDSSDNIRQKFKLDYVREKLHQPDDDLQVDVVVIGSGSGGGTIASELAKVGLKVIVLEKGGYYDSTDFKTWNEAEAYDKLYERGGMFSSDTGGIAYLAGSCVGGGSTVNWSASFRTPDHVLKEWEDMDMPIFKKGGEFESSIDEVLKLFHVNCDNSYHPRSSGSSSSFAVNLNNQLLYEAAMKLGYQPEYIPRNVRNCVDCGHCNHGCPYDAKQSTITNLMTPLINNDSLYLLEHCYVTKILYKKSSTSGKNQAYGVECIIGYHNIDDHDKKKLRINAKTIICAAGSIHTPAVLLRSKFKHHQIGKNFTCHPVIGAVGVFPSQQTGLDKGVSMGVIVRNHRDGQPIDPPLAIETPPIHPGSLGLVMSWSNGFSYKLASLFYQHMAAFIHIYRDKSHPENRIVIDADGHPIIHYQITSYDQQEILRMVPYMYDMMYTAGAKVIISSSETLPWYYNDTILDPTLSSQQIHDIIAKDTSYQAFVRSFVLQGIVESVTGVFSAHQMSSCRMSSSSSSGPVMMNGELYECEDVYVADASLCPTALGINPMITTAAFAHYVSRQVMKKLRIKPASNLDF